MTDSTLTFSGPVPGIDTEWFDPTVDPRDDFFAHVNGTWLNEHIIPADRAIDGSFHTLRDESVANVRALIDEAAEDNPHYRPVVLYQAFMDTDAVEAAGMTPLAADRAAIESAADHGALTVVLGQLGRTGVGGPISSYVGPNPQDTSHNLLFVGQSGLGLPDEVYYRDDTYAPQREAYTAYLQTVGELYELEDPAGFAAAVLDFETQLAAHHWDVVTNRDVLKTMNPHSFEELCALGPDFDWRAYWDAQQLPVTEDPIIVSQPDFLTKFSQLWASTELSVLQAWSLRLLFNARASFLHAAADQAYFDFYSRTLTGTEEQRARWKRGVDTVNALLGEEIAVPYVARHFPPRAKADMDRLVGHLMEAYRQRISGLEWMTPETASKALEKLSQFTTKIGYPETFLDFSPLTLPEGDLVGAVTAAIEFHHGVELAKIGQPVNPDEWHMPPQTVNAYYNPLSNEIVFPAAILQAPFFDPDVDDAINYAGIGAVIGHEIGHGFDDQGSRFAGDGSLTMWWTDADFAEFSRRTQGLIDQYNELTPRGLDPEQYHVNGEFTLGENIGDLGGLGIGLVAYDIALAEQGLTRETAPVIGGTTALQRFFYSWATIWRGKARDAMAVTLLSIDPHSPAEFRCNQILKNMDAFHSEFGTSSDSDMWLEPEHRVSIW